MCVKVVPKFLGSSRGVSQLHFALSAREWAWAAAGKGRCAAVRAEREFTIDLMMKTHT